MKLRQLSKRVGVVNTDGRAIGLDIGATGVRAAMLTPSINGDEPTVTVESLGHVELPMGAVVNGVVKDGAAVTRAIKELWSANSFGSRNVIVGVTNQQVVVRDLQMPNLTPQQLKLALPFQAREIVALPMDQAILDFVRLGEVDPATNTVPGLLIAAPREPVLAAVQAVERAGLTVARVDLSSFAALRFVASTSLSVEAVVDLGAQLTSIVIHHQGIPRVVRTVSRGGQELTERLADRAGMSVPDAEAAKCSVGLVGDSEIARFLTEAVRPLLAEIRSSLHFFGSATPGAVVEGIALTGGASSLPGLVDELARQHGIPARVVSPSERVANRWSGRHSLPEGYCATAVSVGLAMGSAA